MDQFYIEKLCKIKVLREKNIWKEKHVEAAKRYENEKSALFQPVL